MGSIGNAFKTGWNNGNLQKGIAATGMAAFGVGMTGAMIHDMKHSSGSIFGGCGCNSFGMGGMNMFGMNNLFGYSPFGMGGMNMFGMNNMFGGGMDMFGGMSMLNGMGNPYNTQMGNMMAFQWGQQMAANYQSQGMLGTGFYQQQQLQELDPLEYSNETATEDLSSVSTEKGEAFDTNTNALFDENGRVNSDADDVEIASGVTNGRKGDKETYKTGVSAVAQSYVKNIGGNDGYIDEAEFIEHEMETLRAQYPNADETQLETIARNAFRQMDLNGSGEIDWKEMASSMATYDAAGGNSRALDGKITGSEYSTAVNSIIQGTFGRKNWDNYRTLFGSKPKSE